MRLGNLERNNYVRKQLEKASIELLKEKELKDITINEIVDAAGVSRVSFYRNYEDKEDVISTFIARLILDWHTKNVKQFEEAKKNTGTDDLMLKSLFNFLKENKDLMVLLQNRKLFYLFRDAFIGLYGPKPEYPNIGAYISAYAFYGIYGWIEEWVKRGMQESGEDMINLLKQSR